MLLEPVTLCPVCSNATFRSFLSCKDYTASGAVFHVEQCISCEMTITAPRPLESEATKYYQSINYISHTSAASGLVDSIYLIVRRFTLKWKYRMVVPFLANRTLLDVGCGTGNFLNHCNSQGVAAYGVEPSDGARAFMKNERVVKTIDELPDIKFDVITLWHVLEHIYDLESTLHNLRNRLTKNGTIFIAVPNLMSHDAAHYKEFWAAYDVPRHLWHFSQSTMTTLLNKHGLTVRALLPMRLDSYYVSLLSEKYKAGSRLTAQGIINAIIHGYRSNRAARASMNYSSIIYRATR